MLEKRALFILVDYAVLNGLQILEIIYVCYI